MNISAEKELLYLLRVMDDFIEQKVDTVLNDSEKEPEKSAVAANNLIKCYIKVQSDIGLQTSYSNVREYMSIRGFTLEEIELFEKKRSKEAVYYRGEQF